MRDRRSAASTNPILISTEVIHLSMLGRCCSYCVYYHYFCATTGSFRCVDRWILLIIIIQPTTATYLLFTQGHPVILSIGSQHSSANSLLISTERFFFQSFHRRRRVIVLSLYYFIIVMVVVPPFTIYSNLPNHSLLLFWLTVWRDRTGRKLPHWRLKWPLRAWWQLQTIGLGLGLGLG